MKDKIIIFIAGLLLGSIISTGVLYGLSLTNNTNCDCGPTSEERMNGDFKRGNRPDMNNDNMGEPPEMPDGEPPQER